MIEKVRRIAHQILNSGKKLPLQVCIRSKKGILARFTNNGVHQNGFQDLFSYTVRLLGNNRFICSESNDFSEQGIRQMMTVIVPQGLSRSDGKKSINGIASATFKTPLPDDKRGAHPQIKEYFPFSLGKVPEMAAQAIEEGLDLIRQEKASANGYYSAYERLFYLTDSRGLELFHPATAVRFGTTITKGAGKGYFSFYHPNPKKLKVASVVKEAIQLAEEASAREVSVKPGEYECIFSPRTFLELIEPLRHHFDSHLYQEGKSALSGSLGKRIFSEAFTLSDDVTNPGQFGVPFDSEGAEKRKVVLVKRGVLNGLLEEGNSTRGIREYPTYPENLVAEPGNVDLANLFKRIKRGIFINKVRYHTLVREAGLEITGLATAGSLYIENGCVLGRVGHLRYHDSLFGILRSICGRTKERILLKDGEGGAALFPYFLISKLRVV